MTRQETLQRAEKCVCGQRQQDYGTPEDNFRMIADLWTTYLRTETPISPSDVAAMMALLKIARISTGSGTEDCWVDLAGYAACGSECQFSSANETAIKYDPQRLSLDADNAVYLSFEESNGKELYCSELDEFLKSHKPSELLKLVCGAQAAESFIDYCPHCGARMDGERREE